MNRFRSLALIAGFIILAIVTPPLAPLFVLIAACLLFRENFPFSNFPMYASFGCFTYYVFVTDENGNPVPMRPTFGVSAQFARKLFNTHIRKLATGGKRIATLTREEMSGAGELVLDTLLERRTDLPCQEINLVQMRISLEGRDLRTDPVTVASRKLDLAQTGYQSNC